MFRTLVSPSFLLFNGGFSDLMSKASAIIKSALSIEWNRIEIFSIIYFDLILCLCMEVLWCSIEPFCACVEAICLSVVVV